MRPLNWSDGGTPRFTDQLVEALVIWGDADTISARIREHLHAGADHIMLHVLSEGGQPALIEVARTLATSLPG